jgi:hypothetical protein
MPTIKLFGNLRRDATVAEVRASGDTVRAVLQSLCAENAALSASNSRKVWTRALNHTIRLQSFRRLRAASHRGHREHREYAEKISLCSL